MAMQAEIKAKWIEALESGKYKQARDGWGGGGCGAYCCLQVLREDVLGLVSNDPDDCTSWHEYEDDVHAAGLGWPALDHCVKMNDELKLEFPAIAQWVRENVETLV